MAQGVHPPQIFYGRTGTVTGNAVETEYGMTVEAYS